MSLRGGPLFRKVPRPSLGCPDRSLTYPHSCPPPRARLACLPSPPATSPCPTPAADPTLRVGLETRSRAPRARLRPGPPHPSPEGSAPLASPYPTRPPSPPHLAGRTSVTRRERSEEKRAAHGPPNRRGGLEAYRTALGREREV